MMKFYVMREVWGLDQERWSEIVDGADTQEDAQVLADKYNDQYTGEYHFVEEM
jgi:hypothetical protein